MLYACKVEKNSYALSRILYRRGSSYERMGNYEKADKDMLESLKIYPNEPYTMNYLAYSWLDRNLKLKDIPIQFRIPMRSGRYLTINLEAQLETIFMAFIFCKISKLKYRNWFNVHLQCSPVGFIASLTIVLAAYSCYAFARLSVAVDPILIQVQVQFYLVCSLHFSPDSLSTYFLL